MERDKEIDLLLKREALKLWAQKFEKESRPIERDLRKEDVINLIKKIVEGDRTEEIVNTAIEYYGDVAIEVFKQIVQAYLKGKISKLSDVELYEILVRLGLRIPLKTRIKIVRHGEARDISEELRL